MSQEFKAGDFLMFQIESGYGLLKLLGIEDIDNDTIWHITVFTDLFPDVEFVERAIEDESSLTASHKHLALTNRAFESTQTARLANKPVNEFETEWVNNWRTDSNREVSDRSVRLLLGIR